MKKERVIKMTKLAFQHFLFIYLVVFLWMLIIDISLAGCRRLGCFELAIILIVLEGVVFKELIFNIEYNKLKKYHTYVESVENKEKVLFHCIVIFFSALLLGSILWYLKIDLISFIGIDKYQQLVKSNIIIRSTILNFYIHVICPVLYFMKWIDSRKEKSAIHNSLYYGAGYGLMMLPILIYAFCYT